MRHDAAHIQDDDSDHYSSEEEDPNEDSKSI